MTLITTFLTGIQNLIYGLIDDQSIPVALLSFTGFLFVVFVVKIHELRSKEEPITKKVVIQSLFGGMKTMNSLIHNIIRSLSFFALTWFLLMTADYCLKADMNIGITFSILCLAVVFQTLYGWIVYKESVSIQALIGISMIIMGVVGISLTKSSNKSSASNSNSEISQADKDYYQAMAITLSIICSFIYFLRAAQAKYLAVRGYSAFDFSIDSGLTTGIFCLICSIYFFLINHPAYTLKNIILSFILSVLLMLNALLGLTAIVKGPMGPTQAIIQSNSAFTTILSVIFLGLVPSVIQVTALIVIILGVVVTLL
eukprot:403355116